MRKWLDIAFRNRFLLAKTKRSQRLYLNRNDYVFLSLADEYILTVFSRA